MSTIPALGVPRARAWRTRVRRARRRHRDRSLGDTLTDLYMLWWLVVVYGGAFVSTVREHLRAPAGTRVEQTEVVVDNVERAVRRIVPPGELDQISDNIGSPAFSYVLAFYQTDSIGPQDADILISLKPGHHPTVGYERQIRQTIEREFPGVMVYFQAADIVSQVLNFGLSAPIDAQISGQKLEQNYATARRLEDLMRGIPGLTDVRIAQGLDYPTLRVNVDRTKALELGVGGRVGADGAGELADAHALERPCDALAAAELHGASALAHASLRQVNRELIESERKLTSPQGLPGRPWYKHEIYAPGMYTGYGVKTLPAVREAIEQRQWGQAGTEIVVVGKILDGEAAVIDSAANDLENAVR